ncbi:MULTISPECIES: glycosyltransferase family 2 protein [Cellvibrio]|uniref:Glycosyltransferase involved in cell wall biosynthesis n=1 Tax=Cellvibrio fibrivorans TaxID=126350 RepID=A0ABU1V0U8_9GAMM|nr:glycosyltransferase family 2 protein [Cellvibrio fibrivorans]MDR7091076.1 glycosyltransferase involved in cell wall biosynthesis [Cellvibrio fibrivorans]
MRERILIIIPAYNEEKNIRKVVQSLQDTNSGYECLVINDGSKDNTQREAEANGLATVIELPSNLGIGGAVQTGFKYALYQNYDYAIQFDGDGQHLASEIPKILSPLQHNDYDVCIGSRFIEKTLGFQSTFMRRIGIRIFEIMNILLIKKRITDSTSGFRAYNKQAIAFLANNYPTDYPEPETVILLGKNDFRIREVSVEMVERQGGESSISGLKSAHYMIKVILAMLMTSQRQKIRRISL